MRKGKAEGNAVGVLEKMIGPLTFGNMLESFRLAQEITPQAMASKLGVSRAHLCDVEKGRRTVSPERAARWAKRLKQSVPLFVQLALQAELDAAGLKFRVSVEAA